MLFRIGGGLVLGVLFAIGACVGDGPVAAVPADGGSSGVGASSSGDGDGDSGRAEPTWSLSVASPVSVVRGKAVKLQLTVQGASARALNVQVDTATAPGFSGTTTLAPGASAGELEVRTEITSPFGAATVPISVTDGERTETVVAAVNVRNAPGTVDDTFGTGGSILVPKARGRWFFPPGSSSLHWMGEKSGASDVLTSVRRYADNGDLDASYADAGIASWPWTGDRSQGMRELFGAPLALRGASNGLELLTGYVNDDGDFFLHVRNVPENGQGEASLVPGSDVNLQGLLSTYYREPHEPDAATRLPDGRIVTVAFASAPAPNLIASVWKNGVVDSTWPDGGKQSIALSGVPSTALQSILITSTHVFVGGQADTTKGSIFAFALSGSGWRASQGILQARDGLSHLIETSDGKVHALIGDGRPGDGVNLHVATLKAETIGAGDESFTDAGPLQYSITERGVLAAGLAGATVWCHRDRENPQTILVAVAGVDNQPQGAFGTDGLLKLDMSGLPLGNGEPVAQAITGPDGRLYVHIVSDAASRLYRIWL